MMKLRNITITAVVTACLAIMPGCKKEFPNIFNMFKVKLTLHQSKPFAVGEDGKMVINDTDSVLIDYTIESPDKDMYQVVLYKTGGTVPIQKVAISDLSKRRVYSGQFKVYAKDIGAGETSYRVWPLDKDGVYLGDGGKLINIRVNSPMLYYTNRRIYTPDSLGKVMPCYISLDSGQTYSYTTGAARSASIDLGLYRKMNLMADGKTINDSMYLYSLSANPLPFQYFDISSWTKRETLFSAQVAGTLDNFNTLNTSTKIATAAKAQSIVYKVFPRGFGSASTQASQFVYFRTPEGKYGVIMLVIAGTSSNGDKYLSVNIKREG
jgi:hypothetical protein